MEKLIRMACKEHNSSNRVSHGISLGPTPVCHRHEDYDETGFETLWEMQQRHFWYRGRHRFLLASVERYLLSHRRNIGASRPNPLAVVDLGGGVGGWLRYLADRYPGRFAPLALADSSLVALKLAQTVLPPHVERYHVDLMDLQMHDQWDAAFLLDVIEHLQDDLRALCQAGESLRPGGYLFVTAPAFMAFWSYNDEVAHHKRRYRRHDFFKLAQKAGLKLRDARYFMFLLSPLYLLSRLKPSIKSMSNEDKKALVARQHRVPDPLVNAALNMLFAMETPLGHWLPFPWGASILGVFQKA
jgi:SAM-dependent methyltransferase